MTKIKKRVIAIFNLIYKNQVISKDFNKSLISIRIHFDNNVEMNIINQRFVLKYNL